MGPEDGTHGKAGGKADNKDVTAIGLLDDIKSDIISKGKPKAKAKSAAKVAQKPKDKPAAKAKAAPKPTTTKTKVVGHKGGTPGKLPKFPGLKPFAPISCGDATLYYSGGYWRVKPCPGSRQTRQFKIPAEATAATEQWQKVRKHLQELM